VIVSIISSSIFPISSPIAFTTRSPARVEAGQATLRLARGILLPGGFNRTQNSEPGEHNIANRDPPNGHVHQVGAPTQSTDYKQEPKYVKCERHGSLFSTALQ